MVIIKSGNLLQAEEDILIHQVNVDGIMGGGVARQIAINYPRVKNEYKNFCDNHNNNYELLKGKNCLVRENKKFIANMFSQKHNFNTDYDAMEIALTSIRNFAEQNSLSVAMPYKIGCGIANGDFSIVLEIISKVFKDYEVTLYKLEI